MNLMSGNGHVDKISRAFMTAGLIGTLAKAFQISAGMDAIKNLKVVSSRGYLLHAVTMIAQKSRGAHR